VPAHHSLPEPGNGSLFFDISAVVLSWDFISRRFEQCYEQGGGKGFCNIDCKWCLFTLKHMMCA